MDKKILVLKTDEDIKMIFDPFRKKIVMEYLHNEESLTAKQVADKIEEAPSKVNYHIKKLVDFGMLSLDKTESVNGILAKYYKPNYHIIHFKGTELSSKVYLSQRSTLEEIYDQNAEKFRKHLQEHIKMVEESDEEHPQRRVVANIQYLYMTNEEQEDFLQEIDY